MKKAIIVVGFHNWGKSRVLRAVFGVGQFRQHAYTFPELLGTTFWVQHHSNDDPSPGRGNRHVWLQDLEAWCHPAPNDAHLISAICPSREPRNDFTLLLRDRFFAQFDSIHLLLVEHKWDGHARLKIPEIGATLSSIPMGLEHEVISVNDPNDPANDLLLKVTEIRRSIINIVQS